MWESLKKANALELEKITLWRVAYMWLFHFFCAVSVFSLILKVF